MIDADRFMGELKEAGEKGLSEEVLAITGLFVPISQALDSLQNIEKTLKTITTYMADIKDHGIDTQNNDPYPIMIPDRPSLLRNLEKIRNRLCAYKGVNHFCDCKYGVNEKDGEYTGCPEIRAAIEIVKRYYNP